MREDEHLSEEQLDYLGEMMNIGAGNAATALSQILGCAVSMEIPSVHVFPNSAALSILDDPSLPVACVRMGMVGDVLGDMFFIVPEESRTVLADLAASTSGLQHEPSTEPPQPENFSVVKELANILAGVYLAAVHDFCKLSIYHTVPAVAVDMVQSLLDESLSSAGTQVQTIIVIENKFEVEKKQRIRTLLVMIPLVSSLRLLADSMGQAQRLLGEG